MKPCVLTSRAESDLEQAFTYYFDVANLVSRQRSDVEGCASPSDRSARRIAQPVPSVLASDATQRCDSRASADRQMTGDATLVVAERFRDEVDAALRHVAQHPGTGSTRYARQGDAAPLRFWTLNRFPFAIFYTEHSDHIAVLRVLHQSSDLPRHLT